jgi:hypothetical protein
VARGVRSSPPHPSGRRHHRCPAVGRARGSRVRASAGRAKQQREAPKVTAMLPCWKGGHQPGRWAPRLPPRWSRVTPDARAVEKDSWPRWSATGRRRDQEPVAGGGAAVRAHATAAAVAASRATAAEDDDTSPEAGSCSVPRPARHGGRFDAWSHRALCPNPRRGRTVRGAAAALS